VYEKDFATIVCTQVMSPFASMKVIDKVPARCLKPLVDKSAATYESSGSSSTYDEEVSSFWSELKHRRQECTHVLSPFASMKAIDKAPARCLKPLVEKTAASVHQSSSDSSSIHTKEVSSMWSAYEQRKQQRILARRELQPQGFLFTRSLGL
jgi:hypothetical protein